jgi:hypothetical protein
MQMAEQRSEDFELEGERLGAIREALAARRDGCLERLDDAAGELIELHRMPVDAVLERIRRLAAAHRSA